MKPKIVLVRDEDKPVIFKTVHSKLGKDNRWQFPTEDDRHYDVLVCMGGPVPTHENANGLNPVYATIFVIPVAAFKGKATITISRNAGSPYWEYNIHYTQIKETFERLAAGRTWIMLSHDRSGVYTNRRGGFYEKHMRNVPNE